MNDIVLSSDLEEQEKHIEDYEHAYERAGQALMNIYDNELWREKDSEYYSFEDYVEKRWQYSKGRASQLIAAGRCYQAIAAEISDPEKMPTNERQVRELMKIRATTDELAMQKRTECWRVVLDQAEKEGEPITADFVRGVVYRFYRGGDRVRPQREITLGDYTAAFDVIANSGLSPEEAIDKFGSPETWSHFDDALDWITRASDAAG